MKKIVENLVYKLYNDKSVKEKLKVMSRWDAMIDDARNPESDFVNRLDKMVKFGKSYRIKISVEELK